MMPHFLYQKRDLTKIFTKNKKFMTQGLLISRNTKNNLNKKAKADPNPGNIERYKTYKTLYFRTLRGAKKLYFTNKIKENVANP